jgi:hypothetical protein
MHEPSSVTRVVVTLNVPPALEERIVDWLLERDDLPGFTTYPAHGHSSHPGRRLSLAEQVSGRQKRVEFRVEIAASAVEGLIAELRSIAPAADIYYFVVPVLESGHLGR